MEVLLKMKISEIYSLETLCTMIQSVEIMEGKFSLRHEMVLNAISLIIIESEENYLK